MIRLARRASLLVAFYLLTSAATAYAECAWVLWEHTVTSVASPKLDPGDKWEPHGASESKSNCEGALGKTVKILQEGMKKTLADAGGEVGVTANGYVVILGQSVVMKVDFRCLPDTVDPRGPKKGH